MGEPAALRMRMVERLEDASVLVDEAALLSVLAGADGYVASVELDEDLARGAAAVLDRVAAHHVEVVAGDGCFGYAPGAPYDRIVVTAGASEVAEAWVDQLVAGGRLVAPLVDAFGFGSVVVFDKVGGQLARVADTPCSFLPIRHAPSV